MKKLLFVMVSIFALATISCNKGAGVVSSKDSDSVKADTVQVDSLDSVASDSLGK